MKPQTKILRLLKKTGGATRKQICKCLYKRETTGDKWEGMALRSLLIRLESEKLIKKDTSQRAFIYSLN